MKFEPQKIWNSVPWSKLPLTAALVTQSIVIAVWQYHSGLFDWAVLNGIAAFVAGLAFDLILVSVAFSPRHNTWSFLTSLVALGASVLIGLDQYYQMGWKWLHAIYPLVTFFYSWHLATKGVPRIRHKSISGSTSDSVPSHNSTSEGATESHSGATESHSGATESHSGATESLDTLSELLKSHDASTQPSQRVAQAALQFACPKCDAALKNRQALSAAMRLGYCGACK